MVIFEQEKCENGGSVAKLYFNSNGGMRVWGGRNRRSLLWGYNVNNIHVAKTFSPCGVCSVDV